MLAGGFIFGLTMPHGCAALEISDFTVRHLEVGTGAGVTRASDRIDVFTGLSKRF